MRIAHYERLSGLLLFFAAMSAIAFDVLPQLHLLWGTLAVVLGAAAATIYFMQHRPPLSGDNKPAVAEIQSPERKRAVIERSEEAADIRKALAHAADSAGVAAYLRKMLHERQERLLVALTEQQNVLTGQLSAVDEANRLAQLYIDMAKVRQIAEPQNVLIGRQLGIDDYHKVLERYNDTLKIRQKALMPRVAQSIFPLVDPLPVGIGELSDRPEVGDVTFVVGSSTIVLKSGARVEIHVKETEAPREVEGAKDVAREMSTGRTVH
jgi:hypothetical protein